MPGCASYTRKQLDELTEWVKRPQVGAKGLVYIKLNEDGSVKSSVDKFYTPECLKEVADTMGAAKGDLVLLLCGPRRKTQTMLGVLRIEMGQRLGLRNPFDFAPLWVCDFPLLEWDDETNRFYAMHHPFTAPKPAHLDKFYSNEKADLEQVCADAYDFVLNGTELGVCALFGGQETIRDYIAFPKNNQGRDVMIDAPSYIDDVQMDELMIRSTAPRQDNA